MDFNWKNVRNKNVLLFIGGAVTSLAAAKFLKSGCARKLAVKTVSSGLKIKDDVEHAITTIKEDAEDLYSEARADGQCRNASAGKDASAGEEDDL